MTSSTEARRGPIASACGTSNGSLAALRARLARTMRCAMVGSGVRNARPISSVVRPPIKRNVRATRASVGSTGWQAMKMSRSTSSPMASPRAASSASTKSGTTWACSASRSWPISSCLRACRATCRRWSSARFFAVAISQAPGLFGTPSAGQWVSAATSASCASSSARPTSRTSRATAPMTLADSIRQTASMARCVASDEVIS